ncbi:MAG TPA: response regulator [Candidatus Tectomicrobia bacterium]
MARILIIDDDDQIRRMLCQALEQAGYEAVEARDGQEGLEHFRATPIDLIITDILMPGKEGLETIMELRRAVPGIKIIAISGGGQTGNMTFLEVARYLGAQRALQKPFELRELLNAVREVLESQD